jgi:GNAT superfamily N-acetyltransferase
MIVDVLVGSFHEDPVWSWAFPDPERRPVQYAAWWGFLVDAAFPYGWIWVTPGVEAAAVWIPPSLPEIPPEKQAGVQPLMGGLLGPDRSGPVIEALRRFDDALPREPHYHLTLLGTHPSQRGRGFGMRLLEANLRLIDDEGKPAYLESTNPVNLARYERRGFLAMGAFDLPEGGPTVTTMWRPPAKVGGSSTAR